MRLYNFFLLILLLTILSGCAAVLKNQNTQANVQEIPVVSESINDNTPQIVIIDDDSSQQTNPQVKKNDLDDKINHESPSISEIDIKLSLDNALKYCDTAQKHWQQGDQEKALENLDNAYSLLLQIDTDESPELTQQKEDIRFTISKRILEIYASRNVAVKGRHNAIPVKLNSYVNEEINNLTKGKFFINAYKRSGKYRAAIVEEFKKAGLPVELSWLPLIESGFNVNALSSARALGLWQFIPSTGYKFGLNRNKYIDERLDPEKSTKAAIAYLKALHKMFGDWATVLAAYNCGEGRVLKVIRSQNVNYLDNFWDLYERLPRETARYVPRFLATLHIVNNLEKYGFENIQPDSPLEYESLTISKQMSLKDIAKTIGLSSEKLNELNSELRHKITPQKAYSLKVPIGKGEMLLASLDQIPVKTLLKKKRQNFRTTYAYHRVKKGESLSKIAKRYNTKVKTILKANKLHKRHYIVAGNILKIPQKSRTQYSAKRYKKSHRYASTHIVKSGDSLWDIARKYGTTTKDIHSLNKLKNSKLSIGQVLKIPGKSKKYSRHTSKKDLRTYRVKNGDVPMEIARKHNMSLKRLLRVNSLTKNSKIYPGQKLYVE